MAFENRISTFLNKRHWIIPALFVTMCVLLAGMIVCIEIKGFTKLNADFAFSIGGELCAMFVAIMMTISILPAYKRQSGYIRIFVTLVTIGCFSLFLDTAQMLVDGVPYLAGLNKVISIFVFANSEAYLFFFWLYASHVLKSEGKTSDVLNIMSAILLLVTYLLPFINLFYPLYFTIDAEGVYHRNPSTWWISQIYIVFIIVAIIISLILSKEQKRNKIVIMAFIGLPIFAIAAGGHNYGTSIQYTSMMISIVLMYAFLYSANERNLYSTNKELGLATNIQKSMLPSIFPAFPDHQEFDIYAMMDPAKEVGGDFYDFFLVDDRHLAMVVADVSDKGIPAALFMMASKIMVQNNALLGLSPKEVITAVNKQICSNNQAEMFVTIWLGILDLETGILKACNAGHERPVIKKPNGQFEMIKDKHGFVVGWEKEAIYSEYEIRLEKGSKLFIYTDGVPEATGESGQFGRDRMVETINKYQDLPPIEILNNTKHEIDEFMGGAIQFDDITMLCMEYKGCSKSTTYKLTISNDNIEEGISPIINALEEAKADSKTIYKIHLVLEELLVNIASYAYDVQKGDVEISFDISDDDPRQLTIVIKDWGKEFSPLEAADPDLAEDADSRPIGGLGIFIVKKSMDELYYRRENDQNILTLKKNL